MKFFSSESVLHALRTFAAAMLALYISYRLDLPRPTWAFITVYIGSLPFFRGGVRAKNIYRICGTLCGAVFSIIALPNLADAPELLVLALACWIGMCLYFSISDGTPRAYAGSSSRLRFICPHKHMILGRLPSFHGNLPRPPRPSSSDPNWRLPY